MNRHLKLLVIIVSVIMYALILNIGPVKAQLKEDSFIDIRDQSPSGEFYRNLDGEWVFFERQLLAPKEISAEQLNSNSKKVLIPGSFEEHTGEINIYGTYQTKVKIPQSSVGETLAIHVPFQYSAYTLFVDGNIVAKNGKVGMNSSSHIAEMAPNVGYFIAESDELTLTMQVSSFEHIRGGFENTIFIGDSSVVSQRNNTNIIVNLFLNGSIFIIGLFMFLFSLNRRQEQLFFIFGTFAMLISARALFAVPFYYSIIFTEMSWLWGTRLEYILTEACSLFYVILLWKWHEKEFSKKVLYGLTIIHITLIITTLFTQPVFFQDLFFKVFTITIPFFFYMVYVVTKSIKSGNKIAKVNVFGMLIIFLAFFNDFAIGNNWYQSVNLILPAVGIYVLIHVIYMSKDFAQRSKQTEEQYKQLLGLNERNEQLTKQLQKEAKFKDEFLANTSHELRNPLHGIINITQTILNQQSRQLNEEINEKLNLQLSISRMMSQTIEDLLDLSRLKEFKIKLNNESLQIRSLVIGVVDILKIYSDRKNLTVKVDIPIDFPRIIGDRNRVIQILFNLIHNAIKYTNEGVITISADVDNDRAYINISDTGIGMSEKTMENIFNPYEQGGIDMSSTAGGLGLGLSVSRELVHLHGGTLHVDSILGEGSTFTFNLALANEIEKNEEDEKLTEPLMSTVPNSFSANKNTFIFKKMKSHSTTLTYRPKILVVDDDPINLEVMKSILSEYEYDVVTVNNGKDALKQVDKIQWDLVITDVMMPEMSGYELTRKIREKYSISELPILLLTARSNPEDTYTGFLAGANDYVTKPADSIELIIRVQFLTNLQNSIKERLRMEAAWMQAQIRPHFLFNTLNSIVSLSEVDLKKSMALISHLTTYLQKSFHFKNVNHVILLKEELVLLEAYLYIEKVRFGERLHVEWDIEVIEGVEIPPLSLQTIVENAVNHGVLKKSEGGTVRIQISDQGEQVEISVIDNGVGMDEEQVTSLLIIDSSGRKGIGLINTSERLKRLFGEELNIVSELGKGTTISFKVPKKV